jgi:hypothetical protein
LLAWQPISFSRALCRPFAFSWREVSHLVLDEIYAVDFMGRGIKFNQFAGSALKFTSKSVMATGICYLLLGGLAYLAMEEKGVTQQPTHAGARIAFGR